MRVIGVMRVNGVMRTDYNSLSVKFSRPDYLVSVNKVSPKIQIFFKNPVNSEFKLQW